MLREKSLRGFESHLLRLRLAEVPLSGTKEGYGVMKSAYALRLISTARVLLYAIAYNKTLQPVDNVLTIVYTLGMKTTVINVKTDKEIKGAAQKVAEELGLSLSTVINAYLRQFVRNKEIHLSTAPHMSPELEEFLGQVEEDIQKKRNLSPAFSSGEEMDRWLNSP